MRWNKYITDKFSNSNYRIIEERGVILVNSKQKEKNNSNNELNLIFILDGKNLKEIFVNYKQSKVILSFTTFMENYFNIFFKDKKTTKDVDLYLEAVISEGWREKIYLYKNECFKIEIFFNQRQKPIVFKKPLFNNCIFYIRLYRDYLFKGFGDILYSDPTIEEEDFFIYPIG